MLTGIGVCNFIGFIWVQPHLLLATAQNAGRQPLLKPKHAGGKKKTVLDQSYTFLTFSTKLHNFINLIG